MLEYIGVFDIQSVYFYKSRKGDSLVAMRSSCKLSCGAGIATFALQPNCFISRWTCTGALRVSKQHNTSQRTDVYRGEVGMRQVKKVVVAACT
jgi:hypothetical protein